MEKRNIQATIKEGELIIRDLAQQIIFTNNTAETQAVIDNIATIYNRVCECINNQTKDETTNLRTEDSQTENQPKSYL